MKRDMELVRMILLIAERATEEDAQHNWFAVDGYEAPTVARHVELMKEAGLVDAHVLRADGTPPQAARVFRLTWAGHDFLDAVRQDTVWAKTKALLKDEGGTAAFEVIKAVAVAVVKTQVGLPGL